MDQRSLQIERLERRVVLSATNLLRVDFAPRDSHSEVAHEAEYRVDARQDAARQDAAPPVRQLDQIAGGQGHATGGQGHATGGQGQPSSGETERDSGRHHSRGGASPSPHFSSPHFSSPHFSSPHFSSPHFSSPHFSSPLLNSIAAVRGFAADVSQISAVLIVSSAQLRPLPPPTAGRSQSPTPVLETPPPASSPPPGSSPPREFGGEPASPTEFVAQTQTTIESRVSISPARTDGLVATSQQDLTFSILSQRATALFEQLQTFRQDTLSSWAAAWSDWGFYSEEKDRLTAIDDTLSENTEESDDTDDELSETLVSTSSGADPLPDTEAWWDEFSADDESIWLDIPLEESLLDSIASDRILETLPLEAMRLEKAQLEKAQLLRLTVDQGGMVDMSTIDLQATFAESVVGGDSPDGVSRPNVTGIRIETAVDLFQAIEIARDDLSVDEIDVFDDLSSLQ